MTAEHTEVILVEETLPRQRLDRFLGRWFPMVSRTALQRLINEGEIRVDGAVVKPTHPPQVGERIEVRWPAPRPATAQPEDIPLNVLFEDADLLVINKPPGLVVHPAAGNDEHTLVNGLLHHCRGQLSGIGGVARPGIVHRLDKDTSGCLVVAKNDTTHLALARQFAQRRVKKLYQAILCGELTGLSGEIHAAIARHRSHRKRMIVTDGSGRSAWTSYRVLARLRAATLVEARLHTGRTHQVRVHFQHLGHPLVGDLIYGKSPNKRLVELTGCTVPRLMLHAERLAFAHPKDGALMEFCAPLPEDFQTAVAALRNP